ncbi:MAG: 50S ribosomal protein L19 [Chloroflexi bacterium]|jgi:large subunit ribosomal protein L19|uniref:Large ribosomal subunit protein bL19 n=1 Tax=Candidatus Thermofonsia Clade 3 bacterium TaxID=2364212 RepID=A0A2M8QD93_9CHLR|nr:50S ribosomal protein L19 [Candidatus Roseilinea sp. NK_OTU-006]PJF47760.1 MAG: 50S ribosomal protein L19 [Candidatus Thermofonsia Clade 3 bacterium]RMG61829.1 MAG: 50S ribosomal protein L19 [Chloroflexota bacterium]
MNLVESLEKSLQPNPKIPPLQPGDQVRVHQKIIEGDRERIQVFQGTVIRLRKGGANASFTVRRIASNNIGVERTYLLNSPRIDKVEVMRHAKVRRAQLYYFRNLRGKSARLKERLPSSGGAKSKRAAAPAESGEAGAA